MVGKTKFSNMVEENMQLRGIFLEMPNMYGNNKDLTAYYNKVKDIKMCCFLKIYAI